MMSMGSLGHYMQDLSAYGFPHARLPARRQRRSLELRRRQPTRARRLDCDRGAAPKEAMRFTSKRRRVPTSSAVSTGLRKAAGWRYTGRVSRAQSPVSFQFPVRTPWLLVSWLLVTGSWILTVQNLDVKRRPRRSSHRRSILSPSSCDSCRLGVAFRPLVAQFAADVPHVTKREANAADDHRTPRRAVGDVVRPEDRRCRSRRTRPSHCSAS